MIMLILVLALVGFLVYLVTTYVPMPPIFQTVIIGIVVIALIFYVLQVFGFTDLPVPHVR